MSTEAKWADGQSVLPQSRPAQSIEWAWANGESGDIAVDNYITLTIQGSTCWGHSTGVTQDNVRTFATNWTGTGHVESSGDEERLGIHTGEYMESEVVQVTPYYVVTLSQNQYSSGDSATIKYRTGATIEACQAASWSTYSAPFQSLGYVQVRAEN